MSLGGGGRGWWEDWGVERERLVREERKDRLDVLLDQMMSPGKKCNTNVKYELNCL